VVVEYGLGNGNENYEKDEHEERHNEETRKREGKGKEKKGNVVNKQRCDEMSRKEARRYAVFYRERMKGSDKRDSDDGERRR